MKSSSEANRRAYDQMQKTIAVERVARIERLRERAAEAVANGEDDIWSEMADEIEAK